MGNNGGADRTERFRNVEQTTPNIPAQSPLPQVGEIVLPPMYCKDPDPTQPMVQADLLECLEETEEVDSWVVKVAQVDGQWRAKRPSKHGGGLVCFVEHTGERKGRAVALRILGHGTRHSVVFAEIVWKGGETEA
mgnify:CR=1 FL=1